MPKVKQYRATWHDENGQITYGQFTVNLSTAQEEKRLKSALGLIAWVEDDEHNRIEE